MFLGGVTAVDVSIIQSQNDSSCTLHLHRREIFGSKIDQDDFGQDGVQWALLELEGQVTENFPFQLIVSSKFLALVDSTMQPNEPRDQSATSGVAVGRLVIADQLDRKSVV